MTDDNIVERVKAIIVNDVRPYIEMDGGTIEFVRYEDNVVYVQLAGACIGCPASVLTLKGGVERQIRRRVPEVRAVMLDEMEAKSESSDLISIML